MGGVERVKNITALLCKFRVTVCENVFLKGSVVKCTKFLGAIGAVMSTQPH